MTGELFILVDRMPVAVEPEEWRDWMADADRVLFLFESHTPSRVWTLTTHFLGVPATAADGSKHLFATVHATGPSMGQVGTMEVLRLAPSWEIAEAAHRTALAALQARYRGVV